MTNFSFQNIVITFLFAILVIDSTILIFILFTGQAIVTSISNKLDVIHDQTQKQIDQQGNLSADQRHKIIQEFENLPDSGFASHADSMNNNHLLHEILGNMTEMNKH